MLRHTNVNTFRTQTPFHVTSAPTSLMTLFDHPGLSSRNSAIPSHYLTGARTLRFPLTYTLHSASAACHPRFVLVLGVRTYLAIKPWVLKFVKANSHVPCHSAKGLRLSFPSDLHSAAVFDSHMPCRTPAMPRPCRSESDFSRPRHSAAWHGMCELASAVQRRHVGNLPAFGFFRLPRGVPRRTQFCRRMAEVRHGMCELALRATQFLPIVS
jgi:hypothetical protein